MINGHDQWLLINGHEYHSQRFGEWLQSQCCEIVKDVALGPSSQESHLRERDWMFCRNFNKRLFVEPRQLQPDINSLTHGTWMSLTHIQRPHCEGVTSKSPTCDAILYVYN